MRSSEGARQWSGFTLIELLVVIAIIAILAGLIVGVGPGADRAKKEKLARVQMNALVAVLEQYRTRNGFYPPGNQFNNTENIPPYARPSLFYELTGTVVEDPTGETFRSTYDGDETITLQQLKSYGIEGLINTGDSSRGVKNYFEGLSSSMIARDPNPPGPGGLRFLVVPVEGPGKGGTFNTWQYNALAPTNNPNSYDLWVDLYIGDRTITIGNW